MKSWRRRRIRGRLRSTPILGVPAIGYLRRNRNSTESLYTSLLHVQRLVQSGGSLDSSITLAALEQPCDVVARLHASISQGESIESACRIELAGLESKKRPTDEDRDALIALKFLGLAGSLGGRVAEHIESLVDILTEREGVRRERSTQAATSTASMRLLSWLPLVWGSWTIFDSPSVRSFTFSSTLGGVCLGLGLMLNLLGRLWLRNVVNSC